MSTDDRKPPKQSTFLPDGRPPTWDDIAILAATDPVAHACQAMHRAGDLTAEQSLMAMALTYADRNATLLRQLVAASFKTQVVYLTTGGKEDEY